MFASFLIHTTKRGSDIDRDREGEGES